MIRFWRDDQRSTLVTRVGRSNLRHEARPIYVLALAMAIPATYRNNGVDSCEYVC